MAEGKKGGAKICWGKIYNPQEHKKDYDSRQKKRKATLKEQRKQGRRRLDHEQNRQKVEEGVSKYFEENHQLPSGNHLAKVLDMNATTVRKHMQEMDFKEFFAPHKAKMRTDVDRVVKALKDKAEKGDIPAIKLYLQLVGYVETKEIKQDTQIGVTLTKRIISSPEEFRQISSGRVPNIEDAEFEEEGEEE